MTSFSEYPDYPEIPQFNDSPEIPQPQEQEAPPISHFQNDSFEMNSSFFNRDNDYPTLTQTKETIKPLSDQKHYYLDHLDIKLEMTNKTFIFFFFPKIYQNGICALMLLFLTKIKSTPQIIILAISVVILFFTFPIIKFRNWHNPKIPKILLFISHLFLSYSIGGILLFVKTQLPFYMDTNIKLYYPFFHLSFICLIITIFLFFTTKWYYTIVNVFLAIGILISPLWILFIHDTELIITLVVIGLNLLYFILFSCRIKLIMSEDTNISKMQYNTIFYSAIMSFYCILLTAAGSFVILMNLLCRFMIGTINCTIMKWKDLFMCREPFFF